MYERLYCLHQRNFLFIMILRCIIQREIAKHWRKTSDLSKNIFNRKLILIIFYKNTKFTALSYWTSLDLARADTLFFIFKRWWLFPFWAEVTWIIVIRPDALTRHKCRKVWIYLLFWAPPVKTRFQFSILYLSSCLCFKTLRYYIICIQDRV